MAEQHINQQPKTPGIIGWGPIAAVLVTVGSFFLAQVIAGFVLSCIPLVTNLSVDDLNNWLDTSNIGEFAIGLAVEALIMLLLWLFLRSRKAGWASLGLSKPQATFIWQAVQAYVVYFIVLLVILQLAESFTPSINLDQEQEIGFDKATQGLGLLPIFFSLVILPPFVEEILFRGFLYTGLRSKLPVWVAAVMTSGLFAAAHLQIGSGNNPLWVAAIDTFVLSIILIYLKEKTGNLWASIGVHMIKNGLAFMILFVF